MSKLFTNAATGQRYKAVSGWRPEDANPTAWRDTGATLVDDTHKQEYKLRLSWCGTKFSALDVLALEPHYKIVEEVK